MFRSGLGDDTTCPPCECTGREPCGPGQAYRRRTPGGVARGARAHSQDSRRPTRGASCRTLLTVLCARRNPFSPGLAGHPFFFDMAHARLEFEVTCFGAVEQLLAKTGVSPKQISGVVVNSSLFNPTPSLSAMIMNRFQMPNTTINYNLGGMGCSGGWLCGEAATLWHPAAATIRQLRPVTRVTAR